MAGDVDIAEAMRAAALSGEMPIGQSFDYMRAADEITRTRLALADEQMGHWATMQALVLSAIMAEKLAYALSVAWHPEMQSTVEETLAEWKEYKEGHNV